VVGDLFASPSGKSPKGHHGGGKGDEDVISPEQEERGRKGEEEIKKRLQRPGGWFGLSLISDVRQDRCGYDFLCSREGENVMVEVKTFVRNGRIFITSRELHTAAENGSKYLLVGVLDDEQKKDRWSAVEVVFDPLGILLKKGEFDALIKLQIPAKDVFTKIIND